MSRDAKEWVFRPTLSCRKIDLRRDRVEIFGLQAESRIASQQGGAKSRIEKAWRLECRCHRVRVIRALLFDAAGTLIEPAEPVAEVYARHFAAAGWCIGAPSIRAAFGTVFSEAAPPDYRSADDGDLAEKAWWREVVFGTLESCGVEVCSYRERALACFDGLFRHYAAPGAWRVFPEVPAVLEEARRAGLATGVVSNFDRRLHGILDGLGLSFGFVLTSADACVRKPDPSIFLQALARLGMSPSEVLHVGDSPAADREGARGVGIRPFLVERPERDLRDFVAAALAES